MTDLRGMADREVIGHAITFSDGRPGIICGGYNGYVWAKSLDGAYAHEYSLSAARARIINGHTFPSTF